MARYWSKIADLNLPHLYLAPRWGDPVEILPRTLASANQIPWAIMLSYGAVCVILRLAVFVQYRRVTDRQTEGQADRHTQRRQHILR